MVRVGGIVVQALAALGHPGEADQRIRLVLVAHMERHVDDQLAAVVAGPTSLLAPRLHHWQAGMVALVMGHQVCPSQQYVCMPQLQSINHNPQNLYNNLTGTGRYR